MRLPHVLVVFVITITACSKSESSGTDRTNHAVEYGDAVGIEFGDATSGRYLAAVAAEKGHSPEKGVSALATALQAASKSCPGLVKEAADEKNPPTLHFIVKGGMLEAVPPAPTDAPSATCMTKAMNGKAASLDAATPFELTIQLLVKKAGE